MAVKATLKGFFCQNIAGLNFVLDKLRKDKVVFTADKVIKDSAVEIVEKLRECSELLNEFFSLYPSWRDERLQCIRNISHFADEIEKHHRNVNVVQLPTAGLGIVSGVLCITGVALAPVTFGASLGITIAGVGVGVAAAATGAGATIVDLALTKTKTKEASKCFEHHKEKTAELVELIRKLAICSDKIDELYSDKVLNYIRTVVCNSNGALVGASARGAVSCTTAVFSLVKAIPEAVIGLKTLLLIITKSPVLHSVFDFLFAPGRFAGAGVRITAQAARVTAKAGGQALTAFGYIGGILGIGVSGAVGAYTIYDMVHNKNKTVASKKLRELSSQLQDELCEVEKVNNMLENGEEKSKC